MLLWIIFGGIAGWVASMIVGRGDEMGMLGNIAVGIIGAFLGGWIADRLGFGGKPGVERPTSLISFATAVLGAVIFLAILNALI
ncbi:MULTISPECIES: GlsB/YeaQ/YmgE family stress response membrane protein [Methylocaldum]|jgi:uncharacterized membrane protein YeaQ/YmgE (transglycosylase-associated protein family)|uniref:GlsB/YeaQ/YmgE family stress response membrane protein n=1 Tax=unclassified Methylocaldum TaxID=2622260 RepID=UPI0010F0021A|nr:GlsB/YeaQ/YmgE family stress response membrane protein [Methylocaldum sp. RMAD-M]MBP1151064.1 putative membrane protein YeaQ/YmgE (transglycosylase-associated protein family) [Methylocaldum sp. RMAD-M]